MNRQPTSGFTLIELLTGMALITILLALGIPSFSAWIQNSQIRAAADALQNGLLKTRAEAIRSNASVRFDMAGPDTGWTVTNVGDGTVVDTRSGGENSANAQVTVVGPAVLPIALTFDGLGKPNLNQQLVIQITNPTGGACRLSASVGTMRCLNVTVAVGGQIKMCDPYPLLAAGDTRHC